MKKSEWTRVCTSSERDKTAIRSWFMGLIDDYDIVKAEILTDIETDREKKLRVHCRSGSGAMKTATRTIGRRRFTIVLK